MNKETHFSDEFLNAFVDNQIATEEKGRAFIEIGQDETLNRQVCELRKLHDLVQMAYREPPAPPARPAAGLNSRQSRLRFGVAASFLLTLGIVLGSQIRMPESTSSITAVPTSAIQVAAVPVTEFKPVAKATPPAVPARARTETNAVIERVAVQAPVPVFAPAPVATRKVNPENAATKVLIHLARDDVNQLKQALDDIESTLKHYRETRQSAHIEVVVNGKGLELVRTDTSAFAARIQRLLREYDNLTFAACQNTIDRLAREQGIIVRLLPGVITIDSGMAEIMRRQNQGWAYLQV